MKTILIIGAGQLGSRHLQALKAVTSPLNILVVDPSEASLNTAKDRYNAIQPEPCHHRISFAKELPDTLPEVEIAIIATNSNIRFVVAKQLLLKHSVRYMILEKVLFQNEVAYAEFQDILAGLKTKAWVNCPMRMMPFYRGLKDALSSTRISYIVNGCNFGLATSMIHYIDHMAFLSDCNSYSIDLSILDKEVVPSKRNGYSEVTGTIKISFDNGSQGLFTCHAEGITPLQIEISSKTYRSLCYETQGIALVSSADTQWQWKQVPLEIPYQSTMTTIVVEGLLNTGTCPLSTYEESQRLHLPLIRAFKEFLSTQNNTAAENVPIT